MPPLGFCVNYLLLTFANDAASLPWICFSAIVGRSVLLKHVLKLLLLVIDYYY